MLGPAQRHPAATARSGERARTRAWAGLARTRHGAVCRRGRSTPRRARDRRARRMPVHATTAMARRPCCCRTPQGRRPSCGWRARTARAWGRSASRAGAAVPADATASCAGSLGHRSRCGSNSRLEMLVGACAAVILSPASGVQPSSFPRHELNRKCSLFCSLDRRVKDATEAIAVSVVLLPVGAS